MHLALASNHIIPYEPSTGSRVRSALHRAEAKLKQIRVLLVTGAAALLRRLGGF